MKVIFSLIWILGSFASFEKGEKISALIEEASEGHIGQKGIMDMTIMDSLGNKVVRSLESYVLDVKNDGDKTLLIFQTPKDVQGTKLLTWSHKQGDDDQWLYLPSLRRVKRIRSSSRSSSFMGSEFSFEDLAGQQKERYKTQFIKNALYENQKIWVLERTAKGKSAYSKQVQYFFQKSKAPQKVEFYDKKGKLLKVATYSQWKVYKVGNKSFHLPQKIEMKNKQNGKMSLMVWRDRKVGIRHKKELFDKRGLR